MARHKLRPAWRNAIRGKGQIATMSLPQNLLTAAGTVIEGFEATGDWTVVNGSIGANVTQVKQGDQSIKWTSAVGGLGRAVKTVAWTFGTAPDVRINMYVHGTPSAVSVAVEVASVVNFSLKASFTATYLSSLLTEQSWSEIHIAPSDWTLFGGEVWTNEMIRMRITITAAVGETLEVSFDNMRSGVVQMPAMTFGFGDANESAYLLGYPYLAGRCVRASIRPITGAIGNDGKCSAAQLLELQVAGWCVSSHTQTHVDLTTLSQADAQTEMQNAIDDLTTLGLTSGRYYLSCPLGASNTTVRAAMAAVSIVEGFADSPPTGKYTPLPMGDYLAVRGRGLNSNVSLAAAKLLVDGAIARGEVLGCGTDGLTEGVPAGPQWNLQDFKDLIDYTISLGVPIITDDDLYQLGSGSVEIPIAL